MAINTSVYTINFFFLITLVLRSPYLDAAQTIRINIKKNRPHMAAFTSANSYTYGKTLLREESRTSSEGQLLLLR